jgi:hypothetical protein
LEAYINEGKVRFMLFGADVTKEKIDECYATDQLLEDQLVADMQAGRADINAFKTMGFGQFR